MLIVSITAKAQDSLCIEPVVTLTENGFRKVLTERVSLIECNELLSIKERTISLKDTQLQLKAVQVQSLERLNAEKSELIKGFKKKVFWKNAELWALRFGLVYLTFQYIQK